MRCSSVTDGFYGLPTHIVANDHLRLDVLAEAGPRIVRLFLAGSDENQLAETPDVKWGTPYGEYCLRGGHRLWHSPEASPRSSIPDNHGLELEEVEDGVLLRQPPEVGTGICKSIEIRLDGGRPAVTLYHRLRNDGLWPVELSPWAITQLPLGGIVVMPQRTEPTDKDGLQPNRNLVLWPYTRWRDPRLHLDDDYALLKADPRLPPCKIGYLNPHGWLGYLRRGVLFCKRFEAHADQSFPDFGCNAEVYCNDLFVELETLAPLTRLEPGQSATHIETWEFCTGLAVDQAIDNVGDVMAALDLLTTSPRSWT
jgi:hypothetical protein